MDDLLPALLDRIRQVMAVDNAAILLAARGEETLTLSLAQGAEEQAYRPGAYPFRGRRSGTHRRDARAVIVDDLRDG